MIVARTRCYLTRTGHDHEQDPRSRRRLHDHG